MPANFNQCIGLETGIQVEIPENELDKNSSRAKAQIHFQKAKIQPMQILFELSAEPLRYKDRLPLAKT